MSNPDSLTIPFIIRDGGGTGGVELTVAAKLADRGHRVRILGPPEVADRAGQRGFALHPLPWPGHTDPGDLMAQMVAAGPSWAERIRPELDGADLLIGDCAWFGPLIVARSLGVSTIGLMSTIYVGDSPQLTRHSPATDVANDIRRAVGLPAVATLAEQMLDADRLLLLTARALELPSVRPPAQVRYVGPQLPARDTADRARLPAGEAPLVLVSLSTTEQHQFDLLRRIIDALAALPVRGLVTVGPIDTAALPRPDNVVLNRFVPHDQVLPAASLVITHAGHGTVSAAVAAGVPLLCVPMGRDQPAVAARVVHHGLGIAIDPGTGSDGIGDAARAVLDDPGYRRATQRMAHRLEPPDHVVDEVEALAGISARGGTNRDARSS